MKRFCPSKREIEIQRKGKKILERKNLYDNISVLGSSLVLELIEWDHKN